MRKPFFQTTNDYLSPGRLETYQINERPSGQIPLSLGLYISVHITRKSSAFHMLTPISAYWLFVLSFAATALLCDEHVSIPRVRRTFSFCGCFPVSQQRRAAVANGQKTA